MYSSCLADHHKEELSASLFSSQWLPNDLGPARGTAAQGWLPSAIKKGEKDKLLIVVLGF